MMPIENAAYYNAAWTQAQNLSQGLGLGQQQPLGLSAGGQQPLMEQSHAVQLRREALAYAVQVLAPCPDPETLVNAARMFEAYLSGRDSP